MANTIDINKINKLPNDLMYLLNDPNKITISFDNNYIETINSFFTLIKTSGIKNTDKFLNIYTESNNYSYQLDLLDYVVQNKINTDIYLWFIKCIQIANQIINSKKNKYIELFTYDINIWKISICKDVMFNYPFTLDDIIFFPIDYITNEYMINNSKESKRIINTLIHEKIHINQRTNEHKWENFIKHNNTGWQKISRGTIEFEIIDVNTTNNLLKNINDEQYICVYNPDTTYKNFKYIWIDSDKKKYYGQYFFNMKTNKIEKKFFQIDSKNKILIPTNINLNQEHPYEIYAYEIANGLIQ